METLNQAELIQPSLKELTQTKRRRVQRPWLKIRYHKQEKTCILKWRTKERFPALQLLGAYSPMLPRKKKMPLPYQAVSIMKGISEAVSEKGIRSQMQEEKTKVDNTFTNWLFSHQFGLMSFTLMCNKQVPGQLQNHWQLSLTAHEG